MLNLESYGIKCSRVLRNAPPAKLYVEALSRDKNAAISSTGALIAYSGEKTGRSPKDKRIVSTKGSKDNVWWGDVNTPLSKESHKKNKDIARKFLSEQDTLYVVDGFAGWDKENRIKIRVITSRPYHALFMNNMLIRPTKDDLVSFGEPDYVIYNSCGAKADLSVDGINTETSVSLCLEQKEMIILGTEYAGEMKKGVFTIMNYLMPLNGHLSMHCSATAEKGKDRSAILFGLSGTGKTTLSADPERELIGDDEHVWTKEGIFNIEGGCYAKAIDLSEEKEPDIFRAIRFGAVLENVIYDKDHNVDYKDTSITENTRASYPIEHIDNARIPCVSGQPSDIIFLTCDAFGVLPPVARLTPEQAMYHFISGYTAKIAGTEVGIKEPQATFSACFGAPFMVWHPTKYAELLADKIKQNKTNVWLVNTGWIGGGYTTGSRIKLSYSRSIIDAINKGILEKQITKKDDIFQFETVLSCPNVPDEVMLPENAWSDKLAYRNQAENLAKMFTKNFGKFTDRAKKETLEAGPKIGI